MTAKKTLVLGASDNPARYSYLAMERLRKHGHPVVAIGRKHTIVADVEIETDRKKNIPGYSYHNDLPEPIAPKRIL